MLSVSDVINSNDSHCLSYAIASHSNSEYSPANMSQPFSSGNTVTYSDNVWSFWTEVLSPHLPIKRAHTEQPDILHFPVFSLNENLLQSFLSDTHLHSSLLVGQNKPPLHEPPHPSFKESQPIITNEIEMIKKHAMTLLLMTALWMYCPLCQARFKLEL